MAENGGTQSVEVYEGSVSTKYISEQSESQSSSLPPDFSDGVKLLESSLGMPVWLLVQDTKRDYIDSSLYDAFLAQRHSLPEGENVALLIHSAGGDIRAAYKLAMLLKKRCKNFVALVPCYAKSAATLLVIGAAKIVMGSYAELGPLDIQVFNEKTEKIESALNDVQAVERLGADSMRILVAMVALLLTRTDKPINEVLPFAINFSTALVRPMMENIDVSIYTGRSRALKMGEEYAIRLLEQKYPEREAKEIAGALVSNYPDHGFVIDLREAQGLRLDVVAPSGKEAEAYTKIIPYLNGQLSVIGKFQPRQKEEPHDE